MRVERKNEVGASLFLLKASKNLQVENLLQISGFASTLYSHVEMENRTEDSYLITWQDDDALLIDR